MTEFTILMPCLNEAEALPFCIAEAWKGIQQLDAEAEILVVDNGSADGSHEVALGCGARVVHVAERGYGAAIIGGIAAAEGRFIIMGDADGSYDFSRLDSIGEALRAGNALVVGNRFQGGILPGAMPLSHKIGVPVLSALARRRFHAPIGDFHCGLRGFSRKSALELGLCCRGMEFATELIARFAQSGAQITQVPVVLRPDRRGGRKSHLRTVRDGLRHLYFIIMQKPLS